MFRAGPWFEVFRQKVQGLVSDAYEAFLVADSQDAMRFAQGRSHALWEAFQFVDDLVRQKNEMILRRNQAYAMESEEL